MGRVIRNEKGDWVIRYMGNAFAGDPITTELLALLQGLYIAITKNLIPLEINTDCTDAILHDNSSHTNIIFDCMKFLRQLRNPSIQHSYIETNRVADSLAKEGANIDKDNTFLWLEISPIFVISLLRADKGRTFFCQEF